MFWPCIARNCLGFGSLSTYHWRDLQSHMSLDIIIIIIIIIIMLQLENANKEATQAEDKLATTLYILQAKLLSIIRILNWETQAIVN